MRLMILLCLLVLSITSLIYITVMKSQKKSVIESPATEMKKIPTEMKATDLKKQPEPPYYVPILMYHYVEYVTDERDTIRKSLNVSPATFDEQVKTLKDAGYTFMTAKRLGEVLDGKRTLPDKPVILTFDDGHKDVYTTIQPILMKYQAVGTVYVITDFLGGSDFMTEEDLNAVIAGGIIEVGAHTEHHVSLQDKLKSVVIDEAAGSKKWLEDRYHINVFSFAYPNGDFDQQAADVIKEAGYTNAVSTIPGATVEETNRYYLYRLRPGYRTGEDLIQYIESHRGSEISVQ